VEKQLTCEERVKDQMESRLEDLRLLWNAYNEGSIECDECYGTGEIECDTCNGCGAIIHLSCEGQGCEKCNDGEIECPECEGAGMLPCPECAEDQSRLEDMGGSEGFLEYGLCFDYCAPGTFTNQEQAFFRYQLSTGGPGDEFRFYVNPDLTCYQIEYWFLDWFDGANQTLYDTDKSLLMEIFEFFRECGTVEAELERASDY